MPTKDESILFAAEQLDRTARDLRALVSVAPLMPMISSFYPTSGKVDARVTITGANFASLSTVVRFGGAMVTFLVVDATSIIATVPPNALTGKVTVSTASGTATSATEFTVLEDAPVPTAGKGVWLSTAEILKLPSSGAAWTALLEAASAPATPDIVNQEDGADVRVMARGLVYARTGVPIFKNQVVAACERVVGTEGGSRALALGRNLPGYVIGADLVGHQSDRFRNWLAAVRRSFTTGGPASLIECHEKRPNNWGTHCGAARAAIAVYLNDQLDLARCAQVFRGWLGDRSSYAGFDYGELDWQADAARPVGINPRGATKQGRSVDGVLPDDQRRAGGFVWPPPKENYVWEALQGALVQAWILHRAGFDSFDWQDRALLRAVTWLHQECLFPAAGDDEWQPWIVNKVYGAKFPAKTPATPGKNVIGVDWTHG
jgi:hypothetical protein